MALILSFNLQWNELDFQKSMQCWLLTSNSVAKWTCSKPNFSSPISQRNEPNQWSRKKSKGRIQKKLNFNYYEKKKIVIILSNNNLPSLSIAFIYFQIRPWFDLFLTKTKRKNAEINLLYVILKSIQWFAICTI